MKHDKMQITHVASEELSAAAPLFYERVREILEVGSNRVARSVNSEMMRAYWLIGEARADYGARLIESLAAQFKTDKVKGFSKNNLWYMRQFYAAYPQKLHALRGELS